MPHLQEIVNICECWAGDGLQGKDPFTPTEKNVAITTRMVGIALQRIQATSFVHPKLINLIADFLKMLRKTKRAPGDRLHRHRFRISSGRRGSSGKKYRLDRLVSGQMSDLDHARGYHRRSQAQTSKSAMDFGLSIDILQTRKDIIYEILSGRN